MVKQNQLAVLLLIPIIIICAMAVFNFNLPGEQIAEDIFEDPASHNMLVNSEQKKTFTETGNLASGSIIFSTAPDYYKTDEYWYCRDKANTTITITFKANLTYIQQHAYSFTVKEMLPTPRTLTSAWYMPSTGSTGIVTINAQIENSKAKVWAFTLEIIGPEGFKIFMEPVIRFTSIELPEPPATQVSGFEISLIIIAIIGAIIWRGRNEKDSKRD